MTREVITYSVIEPGGCDINDNCERKRLESLLNVARSIAEADQIIPAECVRCRRIPTIVRQIGILPTGTQSAGGQEPDPRL